ncbi:hypothetical protein HMPREF3151_04260 [Corynebacterium sp. HMSC05H05]|nr:hypothetical protein HMPREF3151_04260 [Corynebacterium sp. HMSC05H05]
MPAIRDERLLSALKGMRRADRVRAWKLYPLLFILERPTVLVRKIGCDRELAVFDLRPDAYRRGCHR